MGLYDKNVRYYVIIFKKMGGGGGFFCDKYNVLILLKLVVGIWVFFRWLLYFVNLKKKNFL